jgi:L-threonylcarbamoyladenylate synthase
MNKKIENAIDILNNGGIIIYPTDTAFGIGCRIDKIEAVKKLFEIRQRPIDMAVPILVSGLEMAKNYGDFSKDVIEKLTNPYWPGALTVVVEANKEKVADLVRGGKNTIGIRMPDNKDILEVINSIGVPLLGPSANFHGANTPFKLEDLDLDFVKLVDLVLEGDCYLNQASTVIDTSKTPWEILRQGYIKVKID